MRLTILTKKKHLLYLFLISFVFSLLTVALGAYKPPSKPSAPKSPTTTTGTRGGCQENNKTSLTALAPQIHIGQTVSQYPTFTWFVPDSQPFPMEFRLYNYDSSDRPQLIEKVKLPSKPGIMQYSLSPRRPGLAVGQTYRWQVVIFCDPNRPSSAVATEALVQVVEIAPALRQQLSMANDPIKKSNLLAKFGFWYDAFAEVSQNSNNQSIKNYKFDLLEDLASLEKTPQKEQIQNIVANQSRITWTQIPEAVTD
jgi:hypothetical protein